MKIEIRPGPLGAGGGGPFPEVREEMERMEKGRRIMRPDAEGVSTRVIRYNGLNHAFLDKVGVWSYADACIEDIAEVLTAET